MTIDTFSRPPGNFPSGAIVPWFQGYPQIPAGWIVCDGNNGTPDLRNRFVKSVPNASTDPGSTGGHATQSLSASQMPNHSHSATANTTGDHTHEVTIDDNIWESTSGTAGLVGSDYDVDTTFSGSHSHSVNIGTAGSGDSYNNQPSYYQLIFIQRI